MEYLYLLGFIGIVLFILLLILIADFNHNPFKLPRVIVCFDISRKRQPNYEDYIDEWIIGLSGHRQEIKDRFDRKLNEWDSDCKRYLERRILWKSHKENLYKTMRLSIIQNDYKMFEFIFSRNQTRYRQQNYQKYAYTVQNTVNVMSFSLIDMLSIDDELEEIDYETTRAKWCAKNQRKLMNKELKDKIKKRDNYTCQICGKYMPDEVGLHIDHIIPINKGGRSVESNLQVLCDKCNLRKGKRII